MYKASYLHWHFTLSVRPYSSSRASIKPNSMADRKIAERLGMTYDEAQLLVAQARNEADNPAFKVRGQKPICMTKLM